jgi:hypothetical protein
MGRDKGWREVGKKEWRRYRWRRGCRGREFGRTGREEGGSWQGGVGLIGF